MEFLITIIIVLCAVFILFKNIKKSTKGQCSCSTCSTNCPMYKDNKLDIKKAKEL